MNVIRSRRGEGGSAAIETAFILMLLLTLALGAFEWGMAFKDWLSVSSSTREGARVGASAGKTTNADCFILEATSGALQSVSGDRIRFIEIYKADENGQATGPKQVYRTFDPDTDDPGNLACTNWYAVSLGWQPADRTNLGSNRDWIGVRLEFDHTWKTGFLWWSGVVTWRDQSVMRLEPATDF